MREQVLIIAEAGVNHNGDLGLAKALIEGAAESGANFVKFQTFTADSLVTISAPMAPYQIDNVISKESQYELLRRLELSNEMHIELVEHSKKVGINFLSTSFDIFGIEYLISLGVTLIKVPSGELTNLPYLEFIGSLNKDIILSTGMASLKEVENAIKVISSAGAPKESITILHCTTEYPTPMSDVNLRAMITMHNHFGMKVGYSDHTLGIEVAIAAVALGATVIEKHFTLDRNLPGPDHKASILPNELGEMVKSIRNIEVALGHSAKKPTKGELINQQIVRRSIVAKRAISAGDIFSQDNITTLRPGCGISPMRWYEVVGKRAQRSFEIHEMIEL